MKTFINKSKYIAPAAFLAAVIVYLLLLPLTVKAEEVCIRVVQAGNCPTTAQPSSSQQQNLQSKANRLLCGGTQAQPAGGIYKKGECTEGTSGGTHNLIDTGTRGGSPAAFQDYCQEFVCPGYLCAGDIIVGEGIQGCGGQPVGSLCFPPPNSKCVVTEHSNPPQCQCGGPGGPIPGGENDYLVGYGALLTEPVVEQARSFWDYPPFAQIKAFVDLLRRFPPGSWIFPVFDPVLSNELAVVLRLMAVAADDAEEKIVLALEEVKRAQDVYNNAAASEATSKVIAEAKTAVDDAFQAFVDAVNNAQENLIIAQNDVNTAHEVARLRDVQLYGSGGGGRPAENSQEVTNEVIKSADTVQARLARLMNELKVEEVLTKAGITTVPTGRIERGRNIEVVIMLGNEANDSLKGSVKRVNKILTENDKNTEKVQKAVNKEVKNLAGVLKGVGIQAEKVQQNPTEKSLKNLSDKLRRVTAVSENIDGMFRQTGLQDSQAQDLVDDMKIFEEARAVIDVPQETIATLVGADPSKQQMQKWAVLVRDATEFSRQVANGILSNTVTVVLTAPGEPPPAEQAWQALQEESVSLTTAARAPEAEQAAAQEAEAPTTVLEVTLKPSIEAVELSKTYSKNFDAGEFLDVANRLPPVYAQENIENVNITAEITFDGHTVTAEQDTGPMQQGTSRPVKLALSRLSLQTQTALNDASGNINLELTSNPVNAAGFLPPPDDLLSQKPCNCKPVGADLGECQYNSLQKGRWMCESASCRGEGGRKECKL